jgi:hypothetical protein
MTNTAINIEGCIFIYKRKHLLAEFGTFVRFLEIALFS